MLTGFVDKIGAFDVVHRPQGSDFGAVDINSAPKGCVHTTEGNSEVPEYGSNAPQLTIGKNGLYQHRAFGRMAGTLRNDAGGVETNRLVRIQFELVGFSSVQPWLPESDKQREMMADVFQFAKNELDVPARHVWPDIVGPGPQAVETYSRRHSKFPGEPGWYNHGEVPENCVTPDTPVLCADLRWRPAGDLIPGDEIVTFDEHGDRRLRTGIVEMNHLVAKECVIVETDRGPITASLDHPWLVRRPAIRSNGKPRSDQTGWAWATSRDLVNGDEIAYFCEPWEQDRSWEAGWLAGMYDGEGCLAYNSEKGHWVVEIGQRIGLAPTLDRIKSSLTARGFDVEQKVRSYASGPHPREDFAYMRIRGGRQEIMRFLGTIRPPRFMERDLSTLWDGGQISRSVKRAHVENVFPVGSIAVSSMQTSTRTFIANGMCVHNSHWDGGSLLMTRLMDGSDEPDMVRAYAFVEVKNDKDGHRVAKEISPFFADRSALRDWAVTSKQDSKDKLRLALWQALVENRVRVADRRVKAKLIRS